MTPRVLIVDDDRELCALLRDYLTRAGLQVSTVHDANAALELLHDDAQRPDLLILDLMLPGMDGLSALKELRRRHTLPVVMLSARGEPVDRVVGLELGADDYLAKPCVPQELLARVRAQLRRYRAEGQTELVVGHLRIARGERRAWVSETELRLTGAEYSLLVALAQRAGHVVDKATLTREALGRQIERFDRSIDVHVSRLRKKLLGASPQAPRVTSIRGAGYQLMRRDS